MRAALVLTFAAGACSAGCIVSFDEVAATRCDGGGCADARRPEAGPHDVVVRPDVVESGPTDVQVDPCKSVADGGSCGTGDSCHDAPVCLAGVCTQQPKTDGTPCAPPLDVCHSVPVCTKGVCGASTPLTDGAQWMPGDDNARCCKGQAVETTTVDNCGVCDVKCNTGLGQSCTQVSGHYFCTPCKPGQCWSGCCSLTMSPNGHCSPSDCSTGSCACPDVCPDKSHCQADVVNYCSY